MKVGGFGTSHGIKGLIKVFTEGETLRTLIPPFECFASSDEIEFTSIKVISLNPNGSYYLCQVEGFHSPEAVIQLRNHSIWVDRKFLPQLKDGEIYTEQLIGLEIISKESKTNLDYYVKDVLDNPAHPILLLVSKTESKSQVMIPFINQFVGDWNLKENTLEVIDWEQWFLEI